MRPTAPEPDKPFGNYYLKSLPELLGIIPLPWLDDKKRTMAN
jgi:hypothetical protein